MSQATRRAVVIAETNPKLVAALSAYYGHLGYEVHRQFEDAPDNLGALLLADEIRKTGHYSSVEVVP